MIDLELLEILVCPATHQKVDLMPQDQLDETNQRISQGILKTVGGQEVTETLEAGLLRQDGRILYPIRQGIPVMLIDEGLLLKESVTSES